jgi:hypothetical protein
MKRLLEKESTERVYRGEEKERKGEKGIGKLDAAR